MRHLRRFWIRFDRLPRPTALNLGCGVTAYDRDDALTLLRERVFGGKAFPSGVHVTEDVELSSLEQNHVLPNVGIPDARGIWFPQGFDKTSDGR